MAASDKSLGRGEENGREVGMVLKGQLGDPFGDRTVL